MSARTIFLAKLLGYYCVIVAIAMFAHAQTTIAAAYAIVRDPGLLMVLGVIILFAGLAIVLVHNVWSGGLLPVAITILGWVALIKSLLFLFLTPSGEVAFVDAVRYQQYFYGYAAFTLVLGAYLIVAGSRAAAR